MPLLDDTKEVLVDLIQNNPDDPLIGYNELIDRLNVFGHGLDHLDEDNPWAGHPLNPVFEAIDQEDAQAGNAFRTAIVVRKGGMEGNTTPGFGFWEARARLANKPRPSSSMQRMIEWAEEVKTLVTYWKDR